MSKSLKEKAVSGMVWNGIERFGSSLFLFISNIVLARLLSPDDFGCIGMLMVFISLSDAIVDGGFGSALIQKKNPTQTDYSTIFFWNIILSILMYAVLFLTAPFIADFYSIPLLRDILRVQGLVLIFNAFSLIQINVLKKKIAFKRIAKINLLSVFVGTVLGLIFAYGGWGVWSLVIKVVTTAVLSSFIYWLIPTWKPTTVFCWQSFRELFRFGGFMFLISILMTVYSNIIQLIIGRFFSAVTLGYYTQARKMEDLPRSSFSSVVTNVIFPVFSSLQDDLTKVKNAARTCTKGIAYINFPLMILLIVTARPLFILLFTAKWAQAIPYFQLLCVTEIVLTLIEVNCRYMISLGDSKTNLRIVLIQCLSAIVFIFLGIPWGIYGVLIGFMLSRYLSFIASGVYIDKLLNYTLKEQICDVLPLIGLSLVAGVLSYLLVFVIEDMLLLLCLQVIVYLILYVGISHLFNVQTYQLYCRIVKEKMHK